ncbi:MAG: ribonuclease P protein component [Parabacteroides sp.]|nr:ribonuclease P protein component [Parabacteroides sp.]
MTKKQQGFPKQERLSLKRHTDRLFAEGRSFAVYPLRAVYVRTDEAMPARVSVLVSVPKKKFKRAVKRNYIKRLVREAYRLHKHELTDSLAGNDRYLLLAFIYLDKELPVFATIERSVTKALRLLAAKEQPGAGKPVAGNEPVSPLSAPDE